MLESRWLKLRGLAARTYTCQITNQTSRSKEREVGQPISQPAPAQLKQRKPQNYISATPVIPQSMS